MFKRISVCSAIIVAATLSGCAHDTAKPLASAKQPELLREFVPPPDVKITENGEVPILDAANGLPAKARVLLAEVPQAKPREGYVEYRVGVQPEGFQTVWVGTETIEPVFFGNKRRDTDNVYGIEPNFSQEPKDSVAEGRLRWLSSNPPLLLILAPEYMGEGTGHHLSRHDILVFFENGAPQVLLHEILGISGKSGSACQYGGDREIISETVAGGLKLTFIDSDWAEEDVDARSPLHPQWWPVQPEYPYETGYWYGEIATKRTRTWVFADGRLTLESEKLEYKVQPGDTWEDIAVGFFKDAKFAEAIRKANPGLGKAAMPPEGSWITLPPGARLYP